MLKLPPRPVNYGWDAFEVQRPDFTPRRHLGRVNAQPTVDGGIVSSPWLLEQEVSLDPAAEVGLGDALRRVRAVVRSPSHPLAISLHDIVILDNKKWFGGSDLRIDALVVQGQGSAGDPGSFYMPQTFRFPGVRDGEHLPTGESGLLIFYGRPAYFLDVFITVSRDRKDSDDLANVLTSESQGINDAVGDLVSLVAMPEVAALKTALGAAAKLGQIAYQVLRSVTGATVGLLHTSWLEHRDGFGVGRHPQTDTYTLRDLRFWYEIAVEDPDFARS
jgi:hypothetical protein